MTKYDAREEVTKKRKKKDLQKTKQKQMKEIKTAIGSVVSNSKLRLLMFVYQGEGHIKRTRQSDQVRSFFFLFYDSW